MLVATDDGTTTSVAALRLAERIDGVCANADRIVDILRATAG